jgi:hypothetical protein
VWISESFLDVILIAIMALLCVLLLLLLLKHSLQLWLRFQQLLGEQPSPFCGRQAAAWALQLLLGWLLLDTCTALCCSLTKALLWMLLLFWNMELFIFIQLLLLLLVLSVRSCCRLVPEWQHIWRIYEHQGGDVCQLALQACKPSLHMPCSCAGSSIRRMSTVIA